MRRKIARFLSDFGTAAQVAPAYNAGTARRTVLLFGLAGLVALGLSKVHQEPAASKAGMTILHPWSKGGAQVGGTLPVFMTIENKGGLPDKLLHVESPAGEETAIRAVEKGDGGLNGSRLDGFAIMARERVVLRPERMKIELLNVVADMRPGGAVAIDLLFERAGKLSVVARIEAEGEPEHSDHF